MSGDLQLHQPTAGASLNRNFFRPRFEDTDLEAAWLVERIVTFRRVNRRALGVLLVIALSFLAMDMAFIQSDLQVTLTRLGFVVFLAAVLAGVNAVRSVQQGDALMFVATAAGLAVAWFQVHLKLPAHLINDWWLVSAALLIILVLVLIETTLLARLGLASLMSAMSLSAPIQLGKEPGETVIGISHVFLVLFVGWVAAWQVEVSRRLAFARQLEVEEERARTVELLRNILPVPIADRLLSEPGTIAERHSGVTVLFADIVGFTPWASSCEAAEVVGVLDQIFSAFDGLCDEHGVEKIKTIGDAYMAAGGVPDGDGPSAPNVVRVALGMIAVVEDIPVQKGTSLQLRIGIHEGPVVAGVIGRRKFIYDLWGDTVNTAARMESHGVPGRVQVTEVVAEQLGDEFTVENRGMIEVKGKGPMTAYLVGNKATDDLVTGELN